jgi:hypothetical protein
MGAGRREDLPTISSIAKRREAMRFSIEHPRYVTSPPSQANRPSPLLFKDFYLGKHMAASETPKQLDRIPTRSPVRAAPKSPSEFSWRKSTSPNYMRATLNFENKLKPMIN